MTDSVTMHKIAQRWRRYRARAGSRLRATRAFGLTEDSKYPPAVEPDERDPDHREQRPYAQR